MQIRRQPLPKRLRWLRFQCLGLRPVANRSTVRPCAVLRATNVEQAKRRQAKHRQQCRNRYQECRVRPRVAELYFDPSDRIHRDQQHRQQRPQSRMIPSPHTALRRRPLRSILAQSHVLLTFVGHRSSPSVASTATNGSRIVAQHSNPCNRKSISPSPTQCPTAANQSEIAAMRVACHGRRQSLTLRRIARLITTICVHLRHLRTNALKPPSASPRENSPRIPTPKRLHPWPKTIIAFGRALA